MATIFARKSASGRTVWYLNWRDPNNSKKRHKEPLGEITKAAARAVLTQKKLELLKNPAGVAPAVIFSEFAIRYLAWYRDQHPRSHPRIESLFNCHLIPHFKDQPINLINRTSALEFRSARLKAGAAVATINKEVKALKASLERACDVMEILEVNPLTRTKRGSGRTSQADPLYLPEVDDTVPKYLAREQLEDLYKRSSPRNAALWKFMANTGVRGAEMRALLLSDVAVDRKQLIVRSLADCPTKGRKSRIIPLNPMALSAWAVLVEMAKSGYRGYALPRVTIRSFLRWYENDSTRGHYHTGRSTPNPVKVPHLGGFELALNGSTLHCLRHTFASHLVMGGCDLSALQRLMGHADIKTTMIYSHLARDYMAETTTKIAL